MSLMSKLQIDIQKTTNELEVLKKSRDKHIHLLEESEFISASNDKDWFHLLREDIRSIASENKRMKILQQQYREERKEELTIQINTVNNVVYMLKENSDPNIMDFQFERVMSYRDTLQTQLTELSQDSENPLTYRDTQLTELSQEELENGTHD